MFVYVMIVVLLALGTTSAFNLDTDVPIVKKSAAAYDTYFGFSVTAQRLPDAHTVLLVGAPRDNGSSPWRLGMLYQCPMTSLTDDCAVVDVDWSSLIDPKDYVFENVNDQWMGASLSSQYNASDGYFLACAHRYRIINTVSKYSWGKGICILFTSDFYAEQVLEPCQNYGAVHDFKHDQCQCQAGVAVSISAEGDYVIGAPGSLDRRGSLHKNNIAKSLFDDTQWYDDPDDDDLPEEHPSLDDYLGMAVGIGNLVDGRQTYVAGAPRKMNNVGQVALFVQGRDRLELEFTFSGEQIASGFGYALTVGDFNADGNDDLVVGSPFYFERGVGGVIYVYLSGPQGVTSGTQPQRITSRVMSTSECDSLRCEHARFGYALTNIGDLDRDGYSDLAVGAPLEGAGVVYIFRGSAGGISSEYSQRISAADVSRAVGLTNFGHTFGHTPGLDVDSNAYPDLIVGAYSAATVVVLRSRPVVSVMASLSSDPGMINPADTVCSDGQPNNCFQLKICLEFSAEPAHRLGSQLSINYSVEAEKFRGTAVSRVYFKGQPETSHLVDGVISARRMNSSTAQSCVGQTVYIKSNIQDMLNSIYFRLDYNITEHRRPMMSAREPLTDLNQFPVVNPYSLRPQLAVPFLKQCGPDEVCTSQLELTVAVVNLDKNEWNQYELRIGKDGGDELELYVSVVNGGEDAHEATVTVTLPRHLAFRRSDEQAKLYSCTAADDKVLCSVGNPLHSNEESTFQLTLGPGDIEQSVDDCQIIVVANTTSVDVNEHIEILHVTITIEADLAILGRSDPSTVLYRTQDDSDTPPANWDAIGPQVKHIYEVRNVGVVRMPPSMLNVDWPLQLRGGDTEFVLYLVREPQIANEFTASCTYDSSVVNPLRIPEKTRVLLSNAAGGGGDDGGGDLTDADSSPQTQPSRYQRAISNVLDCDSNGLECPVVSCVIAELSPGDSAVITFHARLWNRTISRNYADETELHVVSTARLSVGVTQTKLDNDVLEVSTALVLSAGDVQPSVRWWIVLLAVLAGLILLLLLIVVMWKVGFFKRRRLSEYQAARMSSHGQEKVEGQPEQTTAMCKSP